MVVLRVAVALRDRANQNDSALLKYASLSARHDGGASKVIEALKWRLWTENAMSTDARRLLLHRDLAELERLAVWIEDGAARGLSADLSFAVRGGRKHHNVQLHERRSLGNCRRGQAHGPGSGRPHASLAQAKVGNLGIHLMRSFAGGMHYERRDNRNRLTMRFGFRKRCATGGLVRPAGFSLVRKGERGRAKRPRC
jgi:hypothetical protein